MNVKERKKERNVNKKGSMIIITEGQKERKKERKKRKKERKKICKLRENRSLSYI